MLDGVTGASLPSSSSPNALSAMSEPFWTDTYPVTCPVSAPSG